MSHQLWLYNRNGEALADLSTVISFQYTRVVNNIGAFTVVLPESFDKDLIHIDGRIEFWRTLTGGAKQLRMVGLIRKPNYATDEKGLTTLTIGGVDLNHLLKRRIVAYAAGSSQASKSGDADDVLKAIVRENLGASAGTNRVLTSAGLTVQPDFGLGPTITKGFSHRNVLDVLREICDDAVTAGTPVYFDIVPTSATAFEFQTFINQRGNDHSATSATPVALGIAFGTLEKPSAEWDHENEINYVYGGGQGEGAARTIVEVSDAARIGISPLNRCEGFADARNEETTAGVTSVANAALRDGRPRFKFGGSVVDTPGCRLGIEWDGGDKLTAIYHGLQYTAMVRAVTVSVDMNGKETVSARLETEAL